MLADGSAPAGRTVRGVRGMNAVRTWRRKPVTWVLAVLLALGGGLFGARAAWGRCWPAQPDPRAYRQYDCSNLGGPRDLPTLLRYYDVVLPRDAADVRYYSADDGSSGPDRFFLHFTVPSGSVAPFLDALHAHPGDLAPDAALRGTDYRRYGVDWSFPAELPHRVDLFGPHPEGVAVVTPGGDRSTVRLVVSRT